MHSFETNIGPLSVGDSFLTFGGKNWTVTKLSDINSEAVRITAKENNTGIEESLGTFYKKGFNMHTDEVTWCGNSKGGRESIKAINGGFSARVSTNKKLLLLG